MSPPPPDQDESLAALGRVVNQIRKEAELTLEELARRAGLQEAEIGRIESGQRNPPWGTVRKISYGLGIPLPELIRRVEALEREA